jgi:dihydroorotate dehydrogenase (NAD+) catalytic subunit
VSERLRTRIGVLALPNPVICGSGEPVMTASGIRAALAAGVGGVIAKSVNERPDAAAQLDRADYAQLDSSGEPVSQGVSVFCRSGLAPYDPEAWFATLTGIDREAAASGRFVAASLVLASADGAVAIADLSRRAGLRVFELNVGAPHASEAAPGAIVQETDPARLGELVARVRAVTDGMTLWVKLTGLSSNLPALASAASRAGAGAVCMMGRFMALVPDLDTRSPLLNTSAAYGGGWALPIVCRFLALSRRALGPAFPLIGTNGVRSGGDVARMALAGASAVECVSVVMHEGFGGLKRIIDQLDAWLTAKQLCFADLVGGAADALQSYDAQSERPGHWQNFVPPEVTEQGFTTVEL